MLEFRKYGPAPPEETEPPVCVVSYPEACDRPAVGEVWCLPFCEEHGDEAAAAAYLEAFEDAEGELHGLLGHLGNTRPARNPLLISAVRAAAVPGEQLPPVAHGPASTTVAPGPASSGRMDRPCTRVGRMLDVASR